MSHEKQRKYGLSLIGVFLLFIFFVGRFPLLNSLDSLTVVRKDEEGMPSVYSMKYTADYHLEDVLGCDVSSSSRYLTAIDHAVNVYPTATAFVNDTGKGLAFVTKGDLTEHKMGGFKETPKFNYLFGLNYDTKSNATPIVLYTDPRLGYDSLSVVDSSCMNEGILNDKKRQKFLSLLPYFPTSGMNECGLAITAIRIDSKKSTEKDNLPPITAWLAVRAVLDYCSTVEEAVVLLTQYSYFDISKETYHFLISDCNGDSSVVEYYNNKMSVTASTIAGDYYLSTKKNPKSTNTKKISGLRSSLKPNTHGFSENKIFTLLDQYSTDSKKSKTQWSAVYNLNELTLQLISNGNQDNTVSFSLH